MAKQEKQRPLADHRNPQIRLDRLSAKKRKGSREDDGGEESPSDAFGRGQPRAGIMTGYREKPDQQKKGASSRVGPGQAGDNFD